MDTSSISHNMTQKLKSCKNYFTMYYERLMLLIIHNISINTVEEIEDDDWNPSKACSFMLNIMCQVIDIGLFEKICQYIEGNHII